MSSFRGYTLTVTRYAASTVDGEGNPVAGATSTFDITASVQPAPAKDLLALPQGLRNRETYKLFTDTELHTVVTGKADKVVIRSENYEVTSVGHFQNSVIPHYEILVSKIVTS